MITNDSSKSFFKGKELLLLEDDPILSRRLVAKFELLEMEVTACAKIEEAGNALESLHFDFALLDLNLPDGESLELLRQGLVPDNTLTILMTGEGGVRSAVEAIRLGATDYLSKPFDLDELPLMFANSDSSRKSARLFQHHKEQRQRETENLFFEGNFKIDLHLLEKIIEVDNRLLANLPALLIDGPTGTGKSTYARWIHQHGPRSDQSFVSLNCSAIPDNLIESELFGHEKGAFTDAQKARIGLFEAADQGTLFLDEIASLSLPAQAKLLTAIESGMIRRVGGNKEIKIDVRIIAAANQDLRQMIQEKNFREDLYHRLDLLRISIPSLSTRGRDIASLAMHFVKGLSRKYKLPVVPLSEKSKQYLLSHSWPGNTRELMHELERALVMCEKGNELELSNPNSPNPEDSSLSKEGDWLNLSFSFPSDGFNMEKEILRLIELAIAQANGNISEAARLLGVPRDYIRYRIKKTKE